MQYFWNLDLATFAILDRLGVVRSCGCVSWADEASELAFPWLIGSDFTALTSLRHDVEVGASRAFH